MADTVRELVFQARNNHGSQSGKPPHIDASVQGQYYGYFENEHREQFTFVYEYKTQLGTLWLGDNGWEKAVPVQEGSADSLILSDIEKMWLQACWTAATTFQKT